MSYPGGPTVDAITVACWLRHAGSTYARAWLSYQWLARSRISTLPRVDCRRAVSGHRAPGRWPTPAMPTAAKKGATGFRQQNCFTHSMSVQCFICAVECVQWGIDRAVLNHSKPALTAHGMASIAGKKIPKRACLYKSLRVDQTGTVLPCACASTDRHASTLLVRLCQSGRHASTCPVGCLTR